MTIVIAAGLCSLIPPLYFLRLLADGRQLHEKLAERAAAFREDAKQEEKPSAGLERSA